MLRMPTDTDPKENAKTRPTERPAGGLCPFCGRATNDPKHLDGLCDEWADSKFGRSEN